MSKAQHKCDECGRSFDTKQGRNLHYTYKHNDKKWHDGEWLRKEYVEKGKTAAQIAEEQDVTTHAITDHLEKNDIEKRDHGEQLKAYWQRQPVSFYTLRNRQGGYEFWKDAYDGKQKRIQHHRLLAVAEYGIDAVKEKQVHHKNKIPWDNRPENIELLSASEHSKLHAPKYAGNTKRIVSRSMCETFRSEYPDKEQLELAEEYGYSKQTVWRHVNGKCRH